MTSFLRIESAMLHHVLYVVLGVKSGKITVYVFVRDRYILINARKCCIMHSLQSICLTVKINEIRKHHAELWCTINVYVVYSCFHIAVFYHIQ